jgi:hypothetical protein
LPHRPLTALFVLIATALCAVAAAAGAPLRTTTVARGGKLHIRVPADVFAICNLVVTYANGAVQEGPQKHEADRRVVWDLPVARFRPLGRGTWYVRCGYPIARRGSFVVVNGAG